MPFVIVCPVTDKIYCQDKVFRSLPLLVHQPRLYKRSSNATRVAMKTRTPKHEEMLDNNETTSLSLVISEERYKERASASRTRRKERARNLSVGAVLSSGEVVLYVGRPMKQMGLMRVRIDLRRPDGRERTAYWNPNSTIFLKRYKEVLS